MGYGETHPEIMRMWPAWDAQRRYLEMALEHTKRGGTFVLDTGRRNGKRIWRERLKAELERKHDDE